MLTRTFNSGFIDLPYSWSSKTLYEEIKMDEKTKIIIAKMAKDIRRELTDGLLFGEPIDLENEDMVIVGAFYYGQAALDAIRNLAAEDEPHARSR